MGRTSLLDRNTVVQIENLNSGENARDFFFFFWKKIVYLVRTLSPEPNEGIKNTVHTKACNF